MNVAHADAPSVFDNQINRSRVRLQFNVRIFLGVSDQSADEFASGGIAFRVDDATARMCGFLREGKLIAFLVKLRAKLNQFGDVFGTFFDKNVHRFFIAQSRASNERVVVMKLHFVVVRKDYGNAALRVFRVGFVEAFFGENNDATVFCEFCGGAKSSYAGADDNIIRHKK